MNPKIADALRSAIEGHFHDYLSIWQSHKIIIEGDKLEFLVQESKESPSQAVMLRLTVAEQFKEIHISNIFMLHSMRRQGLGKALIAKIYKIGKSFGYSLFLVQMVESFFNRMVNRGARVLDEGDCVQITDRTDLNPRA